METSHEQDWYTLTAEEAAEKLDTDLSEGLSSAEAARRLKAFGPNALAERPRPSFLSRLWDQLN